MKTSSIIRIILIIIIVGFFYKECINSEPYNPSSNTNSVKKTPESKSKKNFSINDKLPSIKIISESKYSDTEQIWIAVYDLTPKKWTPEGYNIYKDGKFEFVLKTDEAFAALRSLNGRYVFEPNPKMGIGKKLKECIIENGWFDWDKNKTLCDCSKIRF